MKLDTLLQTKSPAFVLALAQLIRLVDAGMEFPDACSKIATKSGFSASELRAAYDAEQS